MKIKVLILIFLLPMTCVALLPVKNYAQYKSYNAPPPEVFEPAQSQQPTKEDKITDTKNFYVIERSQWPRIEVFGVYSALLVWISFIMGFTIFFIARYAGARVNKLKIWISIFSAVMIGILSRGILIHAQKILYSLLVHLTGKTIAASVSDLIISFFWLIFTAGVAVHLYEIFTVTAKEVFQGK